MASARAARTIRISTAPASAPDGTSFTPRASEGAQTPLTARIAPSEFRAYAPRTRWIRTANDSYFAAMTYPQGVLASTQPTRHSRCDVGRAIAVYGGAVHPTAEGHAAMADAAVVAARKVLTLPRPAAGDRAASAAAAGKRFRIATAGRETARAQAACLRRRRQRQACRRPAPETNSGRAAGSGVSEIATDGDGDLAIDRRVSVDEAAAWADAAIVAPNNIVELGSRSVVGKSWKLVQRVDKQGREAGRLSAARRLVVIVVLERELSAERMLQATH